MYDSVDSYIADCELAPAEVMAHICSAIDYKDNDLGDYNEMAVGFMVHPSGDGPAIPWLGTWAEMFGGRLASHITHMPVDQSFTRDAGEKIWGYPKTVEQIDYRYDESSARCRLEMDGRHVFTLTVPRGASEEPAGDALQTPSYTYIGGVAHTTAFSTGGATSVSPGGAGVSLELGDHPIADELRALGLEAAVPVMSSWTEHMNGSFGPARKLDQP